MSFARIARRTTGSVVLFGVVALIATATLPKANAGEPQVVRITDDGFFKQRPCWSPDGRTVVFARHAGALILLYQRDLESGDEQRLTGSESPEFDAVFSPDGQELLFAFDKTSPNQGDMEIHRIRFGERESKPVVVTQGQLSHEESPCWSSDGTRLAFTSTREGNQELFVAAIDGSDQKRLTTDPAIDSHPAWSPDGKTIAFATNRWGDLEIALIDPDGTNLRRLTESAGLDDYPVWSPDGTKLAFASNRAGNFDIFVVNIDGGHAINVTAHPALDNFPAWTPDGRLGFVSNRAGGFDLYVTQLSPSLVDRSP